MFAPRYFAKGYFAGRYFPPVRMFLPLEADVIVTASAIASTLKTAVLFAAPCSSPSLSLIGNGAMSSGSHPASGVGLSSVRAQHSCLELQTILSLATQSTGISAKTVMVETEQVSTQAATDITSPGVKIS